MRSKQNFRGKGWDVMMLNLVNLMKFEITMGMSLRGWV